MQTARLQTDKRSYRIGLSDFNPIASKNLGKDLEVVILLTLRALLCISAFSVQSIVLHFAGLLHNDAVREVTVNNTFISSSGQVTSACFMA